MDSFSYLSVILSIVLGLAMAQVLSGFRSLILTRAKVKLYPTTLIWALIALMVPIQAWWADFAMRSPGDATAFQPYNDEKLRIWFERLDTYHLALWWTLPGSVPSIGDAKIRLDHLRDHGESLFAFSFQKIFPAPESLANPLNC